MNNKFKEYVNKVNKNNKHYSNIKIKLIRSYNNLIVKYNKKINIYYKNNKNINKYNKN